MWLWVLWWDLRQFLWGLLRFPDVHCVKYYWANFTIKRCVNSHKSAENSADFWGFTQYLLVKFAPLYFTQWTSGKRKSPHKNCRKTEQSTHNHKKRFYILFSVILLHVTQKKRFKVMNLQKIKEPILTNFKEFKFL